MTAETAKIRTTRELTSDVEYQPTGDPMFVRARDYARPDDLRNYLQDELVRMALEGTLSVTALHNSGYADKCGDIILGRYYGPNGTQRTDATIPRELVDYQVRVRSLSTKTVGWKLQLFISEYRGSAGGERPSGQMSGGGRGSVPMYRDKKYAETDSLDCELSLRDAWLCLHQAGKWCVPARRDALRKKYWLYEEVMPVVEKTAGAKAAASTSTPTPPTSTPVDEEPRRSGPGRPRGLPQPPA